MPLLHIQHSVPNFDAWKKAFDSDPMDRSGSGVLRYHIHQSVSDPNFVMIDLEFDRVSEAEQMRERLQKLWAGAGGAVTRNPQAWVVETIESRGVVPPRPASSAG